MNKMPRFLAEWEEQDAIMLALPHRATDWNYMLPDILREYKNFLKVLSSGSQHVILLCSATEVASPILSDIPHDNITVIEIEFNDTWVRDYGPLSVINEGKPEILDFGFNGWGLKFASDKDNLVNLRLKEKSIIPIEYYNNYRDFVLEGGSVESDGQGTILTTSRCLCSLNRNGGKTKTEIQNILQTRLGVKHLLWLDYGYLAGDDTDSHIDTLARLCPDDTIIFTGCRNTEDEHFEELLKMREQLISFRTSDGSPYNLIEMPLPNPIYDEVGERLPATYCNYLVANGRVYMPQYGQKDNDALAIKMVQIAYPDREIIGIECVNLIRQHGSLHCATMQIPKGFIKSASLMSVCN